MQAVQRVKVSFETLMRLRRVPRLEMSYPNSDWNSTKMHELRTSREGKFNKLKHVAQSYPAS